MAIFSDCAYAVSDANSARQSAIMGERWSGLFIVSPVGGAADSNPLGDRIYKIDSRRASPCKIFWLNATLRRDVTANRRKNIFPTETQNMNLPLLALSF